jgi:hypothetical protein
MGETGLGRRSPVRPEEAKINGAFGRERSDHRRPETPGRADPLSYCNNASLRKATRRLGKLYDAVLDPSGLKATQYSLLTQIHALGQPTMAGLASSLLMDLSAMRHSLGPLSKLPVIASPFQAL